MSGAAVLVALALFQVKHYLADFHFQSAWMVASKGHYGRWGGVAHAGLHGGLSLLVLIVVAPSMPMVVALLVLAEIVVHYHIDWIKARGTELRGLEQDDRAFWRWLGLDQAAHHLTYIAMLAILIAAA